MCRTIPGCGCEPATSHTSSLGCVLLLLRTATSLLLAMMGRRYWDDDKRPSQYTATSVSVPHVSMMYSIHMHGYTFSIHYIDSTRLVYLRRSLPSSTSSLPSNTSSSTYALTPILLWKVLLFRHHPFRVPPRLAHQEKIPRYCKTSELSDLRRKGHLPAYS